MPQTCKIKTNSYYRFVVCDECLYKIDTNEIKIKCVLGEYELDPNRDNHCDKCHKLMSSHTELYRPAAEGYEYVCGPCREIVEITDFEDWME